MGTMETAAATIVVGIGATGVMDLWLLLLKRLGVPTGSFALIGRWVGHFAHGSFVHPAIAKAPEVRGELAIGWVTHYVIGVTYAAALVAITGVQWLAEPTWRPAVVFGATTVLAPLLVMQPAMGAGFAASKTPAPVVNCLRSLANHTVFGVGLSLSANAIAWLMR